MQIYTQARDLICKRATQRLATLLVGYFNLMSLEMVCLNPKLLLFNY